MPNTNFSKLSASTGLEITYPCTISQLISSKNPICSKVSPPSATVFMLNFLAKFTTDSMITRSRGTSAFGEAKKLYQVSTYRHSYLLGDSKRITTSKIVYGTLSKDPALLSDRHLLSKVNNTFSVNGD